MNVYDFDGTIYRGDSTVDFYLFSLKKNAGLLRYIPKQMWGTILYGMKLIGKTEFKEYFYSFLSGMDGEKLLDDFWKQNHHKIYRWYLNQQEPDDIIISASPEFLLKPICETLGIRYLIASKVDVRSGKYTGKNCRGKEKVLRLAEEYRISHIDRFYSDSNADLPLAQIADHAYFIKKGIVSEWRL